METVGEILGREFIICTTNFVNYKDVLKAMIAED